MMIAWSLALLLGIQDETARLVERLRSESVEEREDAELRLKLLGDPALAALEKAAKDSDPEVVDRAKAALEAIPRLRGITPALERSFPGVRARLSVRRLQAWTKVFLEAVEQTGAKRRHPEIGRGDLDPVAPWALRGAAPEDLSSVLAAIAAWRLEAAGPELLRYLDEKDWERRKPLFEALAILRPAGAADGVYERLIRESDSTGRRIWTHLLVRLGDRRVVPILVESLSTGSDAQALYDLLDLDAVEAVPDLLRARRTGLDSTALLVLSKLAPEHVIPSLLKDLADEREEIRDRAAYAVASYRSRDAIPVLLQLLDHPKADVRALVPGALAHLRAREAVEPLRARLADSSTRVRRAAAQALASFGVREALPELVMALRDPQAAGSAAWSIAILGAREAVPDLLPLLRTSECRKMVAQALGRLGAVEALPEIRDMLQDRDAETRCYAVWGLAYLQGKEAVPTLQKLLADADGNVQSNTRRALEFIGASGAADASRTWSVLFREIESPQVHVRAQAAWWLASPELNPPPESDLRSLLTHSDAFVRQGAAKALAWTGNREGVPILLSEPGSQGTPLSLNAVRRPELWRAWRGRTLSGKASGNAREAVESIARQAGLALEWPATDEPWMYGDLEVRLEGKGLAATLVEALAGSSGAVFESGRVRVLSWREARLFWRRWWAETEGSPEAKRLLADVEDAERRRKIPPAPELPRTLTPRLKAVLGLEERLLKGSDEIWTIVFLEAGFWSPKPEYENLTAEDLDALAPRALRGAARLEQLEQALGIVGQRKLRSVHGEVDRMRRHPSPKIRAAAAGALLGLEGKEALPRVLPLLDDAEAEARSGVVRILGQYGCVEAVPRILSKKDDPAIRSALASAAFQLRSKETIPVLIEMAERNGPVDAYMMRVMALGSLGVLAGPEHAPHYRRFLKTEDHPNAVQYILGRLGTWGDREAIPQIVELLEKKQRFGGDVYPYALEALDRLGAPELKDQVLKKMDLPKAVGLAAEMGHPEAIPALRKALTRNPHWEAAPAARALGRLGDRESIPALRALLGHEDDQLCGAAAEALGRMNDRESLPRILELSRKAAEGRTPSASLALLLLAGRETPPELLQWTYAGHDPEMWSLMAEYGGESVLGSFRTSLKSKWQDVRSSALRVVGLLPGDEALRETKGMLADPDEFVRETAARILCKRGLRDGVPVLVDPDAAPWRGLPAVLNAVRNPASWKRLAVRRFPAPVYLPTKEAFSRIAAQAGFELEGPPAGSSASLPWNGLHHRLGTGPLTEAVEKMEHAEWMMILEDRRIRILPRKDAEDFWRAWWRESK